MGCNALAMAEGVRVDEESGDSVWLAGAEDDGEEALNEAAEDDIHTWAGFWNVTGPVGFCNAVSLRLCMAILILSLASEKVVLGRGLVVLEVVSDNRGC